MPDTTIKEDPRCVMHTEKIHELELSMVEIKAVFRLSMDLLFLMKGLPVSHWFIVVLPR